MVWCETSQNSRIYGAENKFFLNCKKQTRFTQTHIILYAENDFVNYYYYYFETEGQPS